MVDKEMSVLQQGLRCRTISTIRGSDGRKHPSLHSDVGWNRGDMKLMANVVVVAACVAAHGCTRTVEPTEVAEENSLQHEETKVDRANVTEGEARQLASNHVNSAFKGHHWETALGDREFYAVSTQGWRSIETKDGRLVLKYGYGNRGQDFTVSMNPDGTGIKVEDHGYALK